MDQFVILHPEILRLQELWPSLAPMQRVIEQQLSYSRFSTPIWDRLTGKTCFTKAHYEQIGMSYAHP